MPLQFLGYGADVHLQRNQAPGGRIQDSYTNTSMKLFADLKPVLEKDLGLTLEHRKAMVEVLVVDRADKTPTEN